MAARDATRAGAHRRLRDRRPGHPRAGPEAADLLGRRPAASGARRADRRAGADGRRALRRHLRGDRDHPCRRGGGRRRARHAQLRGPHRAAQHRRRPAHRAPRDAEHRADDRRAPRLRGRPARARGHGRPDELLRGAARGLGLARRDPVASRLPRAPLQRSRGAARAGRAHQGPGRLGHAAAGPDHARRRRHPSCAGHRRLHHRGPAGVLAGAARPGPVPPVRRAGLALAAHAAGRGSRPHARRPSRAGRPALRAGGAGAPGARAGRGARRGRAVGGRAPAGWTSPRP